LNNKLSFSRVKLFQNCGLQYKYHYIDELRSIKTSSALVFGKAIDSALNSLLLDKDLEKAKNVFKAEFSNTTLNSEKIDIESSNLIEWKEADLDQDLLFPEDKDKQNIHFWSLYRKGIIMLDSYNTFILPKIKEVLVCQKVVNIENEMGDIIEGTIDLIARLNDDKIYLLDHKTSSFEYSNDSASKSTQLILYHYLTKESYKIDGVGFIVLNKHIWKKKEKICLVCGFNGSGTNHRKCNNNIVIQTQNSGSNKRCNGEWKVTIDPTCYINLILNDINPRVESLVLDTFDGVNQQIKNKEFVPNLDSCERGKLKCPYFSLCHEGKYDNLIKSKKD
jgi:hypothetical protein